MEERRSFGDVSMMGLWWRGCLVGLVPRRARCGAQREIVGGEISPSAGVIATGFAFSDPMDVVASSTQLGGSLATWLDPLVELGDPPANLVAYVIVVRRDCCF